MKKLSLLLILIVLLSCKRNQPPTCIITQPSQNAVFTMGTTIPISVNADDPDGTVLEVRLYFNNIGIVTMANFPFNFELNTGDYNVGNYTLKATVTDNSGLEASDEVQITIDAGSPSVITSNISEITASSANCGGDVVSDGGASVTARGVCWSTSQNPTLSDNSTTDGNGIGSYSSSITLLDCNATHYVRAYATNAVGTAYGAQESFTTSQCPVILPTVTTASVINVTETTAQSGGNVTDDGNATVTARGVCWSTAPDPTIANYHTTNGSGEGSYTSDITELTPETAYYVRAYATNSAGTGYGQNEPFTTTPNYPTIGLISYFKFDNNLKDQLGNTPDGTNYGGATFTTGKAGNAITLNGTNQYIQFERKTYKSVNNVSVALWLKKPSTAESLRFFIMCSDFAVGTESGNATFAISLPSTNSARGAIAQNTWVHLAGTYDGTNIKVYINGVLTETKYHPGNISDSDRNLTLGYFNSAYWGGSIDDLFIYNKVLTPEEVNQLLELTH